MLAIIGGSGLGALDRMANLRLRAYRTPYGEPSGPLAFGDLDGVRIVFLARHGRGHSLPPHRINYRANLWALKDVGATKVVAVATVGGIGPEYGPGKIAVAHQLIDYTWGRHSTFFDSSDAPVTHVDFTHPYSETVRESLLAAVRLAGMAPVPRAVYGVTQGPRLETAAEIGRMEQDGCDVVGMTGMPEAVLARELDLPYAVTLLVANWAAGRGESAARIPLEQIPAVVAHGMKQIADALSILVTGR